MKRSAKYNLVEYQIIYTLKGKLGLLQEWCNRMARDGWVLIYVNANAEYAIFQRPTDEPRDNEIIYINVPGQDADVGIRLGNRKGELMCR